jgi:hypothetical protein
MTVATRIDAPSGRGSVAVLDVQSAIATLELQQLVSAYCSELDTTFGTKSGQYYTEDASVQIGKMSFRGRTQIERFYQDLAQVIAAHSPGGQRTTRHVWNNLYIVFEGDGTATLDFVMTEYSSAGVPPVRDATTPTIVSDARFRCRRAADGEWRIFEFTGQVVFVGRDPVLDQVLVE